MRMNDIIIEFKRLTMIWKNESALFSDIDFNHPCRKQIIALGPIVIQLIMQEIIYYPDIRWHSVLVELTGYTPPISCCSQVNVKAITKVWLRWGREHGYL